jgi:hypothetical protein
VCVCVCVGVCVLDRFGRATVWQVGAEMASEQLKSPVTTREQCWSIFVEEKPPKEKSLANLSPEARKALLRKVTKSYHKLAKLVHPDKLGTKGQFQNLEAAYEVEKVQSQSSRIISFSRCVVDNQI